MKKHIESHLSEECREDFNSISDSSSNLMRATVQLLLDSISDSVEAILLMMHQEDFSAKDHIKNDHLKMTVLERSSNIEDLNQDLDANLKDAVRIKEELFKAYIKFNAHQEQKSELEESLVLAIRRGDEYEK
ncbi:hypothetical protein QYM36_018464, partial [Artemia franciscana]